MQTAAALIHHMLSHQHTLQLSVAIPLLWDNTVVNIVL